MYIDTVYVHIFEVCNFCGLTNFSNFIFMDTRSSLRLLA